MDLDIRIFEYLKKQLTKFYSHYIFFIGFFHEKSIKYSCWYMSSLVTASTIIFLINEITIIDLIATIIYSVFTTRIVNWMTDKLKL